MNKIKTLIVEDDVELQGSWKRALEDIDGVTVLSATSVEQAEELFAQHQTEIGIIAMDACVPGDRPTTIQLTKRFREKFSGPMLAMSSFHHYRQLLMQAGCNMECEKNAVYSKLRQLIEDQG